MHQLEMRLFTMHAMLCNDSKALQHSEMHLLEQRFPIFFTMHPFRISTDNHVALKFLMAKRLRKITKLH